jgi:uncharacterized protein (TIGR00730 family)
MENKDGIRSIGIYCASATGMEPVYAEAAERLGTMLGNRGMRVINGAGSSGLMRVLSDAVLMSGGKVTGVIPRFMVANGWCHPALTELIEVDTMHERKQRIVELSEAMIALPGGCGTLEELLEIITWKQLGLYPHPVLILNTNHYFNPLLAMLRRAIDAQFMHLPQQAMWWNVVQTPEEAIDELTIK